MNNMVSVQHLSKVFHDEAGEVPVLRDLTFSVDKGEMVALVGVSGAGKTTLLQILGALDRPTSGSVCINDRDLALLRPDQMAAFRNQSLGFVFQFHHLLPDFTALDNVAIPGLIAQKPLKACRERAAFLLDLVGLANRRTHHSSELSGGERQRVALARSLFNDPALILADEPTGNLDSHTSAVLLELFFKANQTLKQTFIIATHNDHLLKSMQRVMRIADGAITG